MFKRENEFDAIVYANSIKYGVPAWVIKATIGKESSFDPGAFRAEPKINDASRGLMQILATTAAGLGLRGSPGDDASKTGGLYVPDLNVQLGTKLLGQLRSRYSGAPWDDIYAAYNAGSIQRNDGGVLTNERNVAGWRTIASYFNPGWAQNTGSPPQGANPFLRALGLRRAPGR